MLTRRSVLKSVVGASAALTLFRTLPAQAEGTAGGGVGLPYEPLRKVLYEPEELYAGYDASDPGSWVKTTDFAIYRHFVVGGSYTPTSSYEGMTRALHDCTISQLLQSEVRGRKVAAIMGGHDLGRDDPVYESVAKLARRLTSGGSLVCSGGGPGAMEAAHLGAGLASEQDSALKDALSILRARPNAPKLASIVRADGSVDSKMAEDAHAWFKPAYEIARSASKKDESVAVPTWFYGFEPSTPFARKIAKYFQNSIREDELLAVANQGIVFAAGKAGTIQEIFQDGTQNYYKFGANYCKYVLVIDDVEAAASFIEKGANTGCPQSNV